MLKRGETYAEVFSSFQWEIPEFYNMGFDICDKWAHQRYRLALINVNEIGHEDQYTFWDLKNLSNKFANALKHYGIGQGDRIAILLPQCAEAAICHIAIYKIGAIAVPISTLFGVDAIKYRLFNCEAKGIITDEGNLSKILEIKENLPDLNVLILVRGEKSDGVLDFWGLIKKGSSDFKPVRTRANDPALIIYTSGTTGPPKGSVHAHRTLLAHIPSAEFSHNFFPKESDLFWTPADWAWIGGLLDTLLPSLYHGIPVVAFRPKKFDPEEIFYLIANYGIQNAFMPPTALKIMRQVKDPKSRHNHNMRSIACGGEVLGEELLNWGREVMGLTINEFYGLTEANVIVSNCAELMVVKPGSVGRPIPGHIVEVVDDSGVPVPAGVEGEIVVKRPDPIMFLEYWKEPIATEEKYLGEWCLTGDQGKKDEDGYFWFIGRKDDIIKSSGYRIGPGEIEDCIMKHPSVGMVAVVGSPDEVRTDVIKAFIVLKPGMTPNTGLEEEIRNFVKLRLAAHEYPREIEFVKDLPMTTTGKIIRKELRKMEIQRKLKH
jgi:acetyl-CoA synthetase